MVTPLLTVLMPAYNEAGSIEAILRRVNAVDMNKEIIVIDDGSSAGTAEIVEKLRAEIPGSRLIRQMPNQGKGAAIRAGSREAAGAIIIIQDADLEYDPSDYSVLLGPIVMGKADVVYGSRFAGHGAHRVLYFWHYAGNKFLTLVSNFFTNLNLTDMETGYKVFTKEALAGIRIHEKRFGFEPEITAKIAKKRLRIYEVPISYYGRTYQEGKKITWRDGVWAFWCIVKYNIFK